MKTKFKATTKLGIRLIAFLLVVLIIICSLPLGVFAADEPIQKHTIIDDPFGNAISTDPRVVRFEEKERSLFDDARSEIEEVGCHPVLHYTG